MPAVIALPRGNSVGIMYGRAPTASVASVDAYQSSGLDFERNLTAQEQITLGTVRLNVVGSGVVLLEGEIANIVVQDGSGSNSELQYQPRVAGT